MQNTLENNHTPSLSTFQTWVDTTLNHLDAPIIADASEVCIRLVSVIEMTQLNQDFRKKSGPTNVLSFLNTPDIEMEDESLGDIAICTTIVEQEAQEKKITIESHWAHLTIHGLLHLLGYDHIKESDAILMEGLENEILQSLGIDHPYEDPIDD